MAWSIFWPGQFQINQPRLACKHYFDISINPHKWTEDQNKEVSHPFSNKFCQLLLILYKYEDKRYMRKNNIRIICSMASEYPARSSMTDTQPLIWIGRQRGQERKAVWRYFFLSLSSPRGNYLDLLFVLGVAVRSSFTGYISLLCRLHTVLCLSRFCVASDTLPTILVLLFLPPPPAHSNPPPPSFHPRELSNHSLEYKKRRKFRIRSFCALSRRLFRDILITREYY